MKNLTEVLNEDTIKPGQDIVTIQIDLKQFAYDNIVSVFTDNYTYRSAYDRFVVLDNICETLLMVSNGNETIVRKMLKHALPYLEERITNENDLKYYKSNINKKIKNPKMKLR